MSQLLLGDSLELLKKLEKDSVDACVTDPPYGLEFMGKEWDTFWDKREPEESSHLKNPKSDNPKSGYAGMLNNPSKYQAGLPYQQFCYEWGKEVYRVLKPGGYLLAMGGTRTYHRLTCGLEDAGFQIRDCLAWQYQEGFPKSLDIGQEFDRQECMRRLVQKLGRKPTKEEWKKAWKEFRKVVRKKNPMLDNSIRKHGKDRTLMLAGKEYGGLVNITQPVTELAQQWDGWGTGLKPAFEPIVVTRKPLEGTVCENVAKYGTGGVNIDGSRIPYILKDKPDGGYGGMKVGMGKINEKQNHLGCYQSDPIGRFPANILRTEPFEDGLDKYYLIPEQFPFFVVPKPSKTEKNKGCEDLVKQIDHSLYDKCSVCGGYITTKGKRPSGCQCEEPSIREHNTIKGNFHPTVKPVELMSYLIKLVTPENSMILDPFLGSGTTAIACELLHRKYIGIEKIPEYMTIAKKRIQVWKPHGDVLRWL